MGRALPLVVVAFAAVAGAFHVGGVRPALSTSRAATRASPLVSLHPTARFSFAGLRSRLSAMMSTGEEEERLEAPAGTSLFAYSTFTLIFLTGIFCVCLNYVLWGCRTAIENVGLNWWKATNVNMLRA